MVHSKLNLGPHIFIKEIENSMQDLFLYNFVKSPRGTKALIQKTVLKWGKCIILKKKIDQHLNSQQYQQGSIGK